MTPLQGQYHRIHRKVRVYHSSWRNTTCQVVRVPVPQISFVEERPSSCDKVEIGDTFKKQPTANTTPTPTTNKQHPQQPRPLQHLHHASNCLTDTGPSGQYIRSSRQTRPASMARIQRGSIDRLSRCSHSKCIIRQIWISNLPSGGDSSWYYSTMSCSDLTNYFGKFNLPWVACYKGVCLSITNGNNLVYPISEEFVTFSNICRGCRYDSHYNFMVITATCEEASIL